MSKPKLACPRCNSTDLRSNETATIAYSVHIYADPKDGEFPASQRGVTYTGEDYEVFDEGTKFEGDLSCGGCGDVDIRINQLVPEQQDCEECEEPKDKTSLDKGGVCPACALAIAAGGQ